MPRICWQVHCKNSGHTQTASGLWSSKCTAYKHQFEQHQIYFKTKRENEGSWVDTGNLHAITSNHYEKKAINVLRQSVRDSLKAGATLLASRKLFWTQICKLDCNCIPWRKSGMATAVSFISLLPEWSFHFQEQRQTSTSAENNRQSFAADGWETTRNYLIKSCHQHNQEQFPLPISSVFSHLSPCFLHPPELEHRQIQVGHADFDVRSQSGPVFWCTCWLHLLTGQFYQRNWLVEQSCEQQVNPHLIKVLSKITVFCNWETSRNLQWY